VKIVNSDLTNKVQMLVVLREIEEELLSSYRACKTVTLKQATDNCRSAIQRYSEAIRSLE
jgi:hypothetical protein